MTFLTALPSVVSTIVIALSLPTTASAIPLSMLSGYAYSYTCNDDFSNACIYSSLYPPTVSGVGLHETALANGASNAANGTLDLSKFPGPSISASSNTSASDIPSHNTYFKTNSEAEVKLNYYFIISGPKNTYVDTLIQASGEVKATGGIDYESSGANATATFEVGQDLESKLIINKIIRAAHNDNGNSGEPSNDSFSVDDYYALESNKYYEVYLDAHVFTDIYNLSYDPHPIGDLAATASIDPFFQISPGNANYSISFSPGIPEAVSAVPLPASAPMFGAALVGLGWIGYGRKCRKEAAAA